MRHKICSWFVLLIVLTVTFGLLPASASSFYYDNPAEEAFSKTKFELLIPQLSLGAKNNLFNLNNLNIDLTDPAVKEQFLNQMAGGIFKTDLNGQLKAGLTIGRFSLHFNSWATGSFRLAPAIPELIFVGYGPVDNDTNRYYELAGTKVNGLSAISLDLKYGHPIRLTRDSELGVGVTLRFVKGFAMTNLEVTSGTLKVDRMGTPGVTMAGQYTMVIPESESEDLSIGDFFNNPPGSGLLFDIGASYSRDRWRAGVALKNIGAITWKNVEQGTYTYNGEVEVGPEGPELIEDNFTENETVLSTYRTSLPVVLQAQGSYRFLGPLYCHLGMETGFSDGWGISSSPRIWTGLEWRPRHLIRMAGGVAYHDRHFNYNALLELRLLCFWANLKLDWMHEFGGLNASAMLALHF